MPTRPTMLAILFFVAAAVAIWFAVENREALTDAAYDLIACPNC